MRLDNRVLCLEQPVARMPMGHAVPRRAEQSRGVRDQKRFLLIWSDPFGDLSWTKQEIESIARALRAEPGTDVIVEEAVTNKMLNDRLEAGDDYDVIHYAGHARFHPTNADESALLVHARKTGRSGTQRLLADHYYAEKIRRILHGQPLVFLNACQTAQIQSEQRDETGRAAPPGGLASAFVYGGAKACVGSLWPVRDDYAAEFAVEFYKRLLEGETIGEAMRQARTHTRDMHGHSQTWSTFVLYGNPMFRL
jgi:CHAT domain-containing protein